MKPRNFAARWVIPLVLLGAPLWAMGQQKQQQFLRYVDDGHGGGRLQAAVVTLKNDAGVSVQLVAAVHIADRAFYEHLNELFKTDDAVLYEMVKPRDMAPPAPGEVTGSEVSMIQRFLKNALQLDFQLDDINYTAANFIHADLDSQTFYQLQKQRGESMLSLMLDMMLKNLTKAPAADAPEPTLADIIRIFTDPDGARQAKILLARQFSDIDTVVSALNGTVLLTARNNAAIETFQKTVASGKRNIAIFFGAAHMPGIEQRLDDMGYKQTGVQWLTAWNLTAPAAATEPATTAPAP